MKSLKVVCAVFVTSAAFAFACGGSTPEAETPEPAMESEAAAEEPAATEMEEAPATADAGAPMAE